MPMCLARGGLHLDDYTTSQGDTFDSIALDFYGDEFKAPELILANPEYAGVIVFEAGVTLSVPELEDTAASTLPPWRL